MLAAISVSGDVKALVVSYYFQLVKSILYNNHSPSLPSAETSDILTDAGQLDLFCSLRYSFLTLNSL